MSTGGWVFTTLWTLIILAILAAAIIWIVSALRGRDTTSPGDSPREIIDRRFANGELTLEQYREMRGALHNGGPGDGPAKPAGAG